MEAPGDCSPSRNVVSKILIRRGLSALIVLIPGLVAFDDVGSARLPQATDATSAANA
jgi:hypothetical protein